MISALKESGLVVFGASTGTEFAREDDQWDRHGAFTKALIEAIGEGKASTDATGRITTTMLDLYVEERVKELTNGAQHPVILAPTSYRISRSRSRGREGFRVTLGLGEHAAGEGSSGLAGAHYEDCRCPWSVVVFACARVGASRSQLA